MSDLTTVTTEQHYLAMIDSANLIISGQINEQSDEDWQSSKKRNKEHLEHMLNKISFDDYDLSLINQAISIS